MKNKFTNILLALALLLLLFNSIQNAEAIRALQEEDDSKAASPSLVSYQGYVTLSGAPYNGTGYFKFAVVNSAGTTSYWSNDGTSSGGGEPSASVSLTVSNGLFNVLLGKSPMQAINASVFSNSQRRLRVWFSSAPGGSFSLLAPDREFTSAPYAFVSDLLDGLDSSAFQLRVSGTCPVGYAVREVNADGSVTCMGVDPKPVFLRTTLDEAGDVGDHNSIIIGIDGLGLISYYDATNGDLKVAHCDNVGCTSATVSVLDSVGTVGGYSSITIGADGLGLISYYDFTNANLKVAHCNDSACTSAGITTLDSGGNVGMYTSITIDDGGYGWISYYDDTNDNLKVARCHTSACTSATISTLDSGGDVGLYTSITTGVDGRPLIAYMDFTNANLKVAHCNDGNCSAPTLSTLDSTGLVGYDPSITIGADGLGLISYTDGANQDLKVAHCSNATCSAASIATLDSDYATGFYSSITIGWDGLGLISYYYSASDMLKVAHCSNYTCSTATYAFVDQEAAGVGAKSSITIGMDGMGLISYYDQTNDNLRVAHLSNTHGTRYTRRR